MQEAHCRVLDDRHEQLGRGDLDVRWLLAGLEFQGFNKYWRPGKQSKSTKAMARVSTRFLGVHPQHRYTIERLIRMVGNPYTAFFEGRLLILGTWDKMRFSPFPAHQAESMYHFQQLKVRGDGRGSGKSLATLPMHQAAVGCIIPDHCKGSPPFQAENPGQSSVTWSHLRPRGGGPLPLNEGRGGWM